MDCCHVGGMIVTSVIENQGKAPDAILWMPKGEHIISASKNGKPYRGKVTVTAAAVQKLQADLESKLSRNVKPVVYYDHKRGPVAFQPSRFEWDEEKGIVLCGSWTSGGKKSVEGGDYAYFSPAFLLSKTGEVAGLPRDIEVGSLVNDPAFEEIERIAAAFHDWTDEELARFADIDDFQENDNNESLKAENQPASTSNKNMDIKQLQDIGILTADEVKAANAETIALDKLKKMRSDSEAKSEELEATKKKLTDKEGELTKCQKELDGYKDEIKAARDNTEAQAKAKVEEAVKAGKIGPKDESAQAFWQKALEDDFVTASKQIDAMGANPALSTEKVAGGKTVTEKKEDEEESGFDRLTAAFNEELKND